MLEARKGPASPLAVCVIEPKTRTDLNGLVRRRLGARRVSLAAREVAVDRSGMEYGSITPVGLPAEWPALISAPLVTAPVVVISSGLLKAKLRLPGAALLALTDGTPVQDLAQPLWSGEQPHKPVRPSPSSVPPCAGDPKADPERPTWRCSSASPRSPRCGGSDLPRQVRPRRADGRSEHRAACHRVPAARRCAQART